MNSMSDRKSRGFILISVMMMMAVLLTLFSSYFFITNMEIGTSRMSKDSVQGFYAAEAGLNVRAERIRQTFVGYNVPVGPGPTEPNPCTGGNVGANDFICANYSFNKQDNTTTKQNTPVKESIPKNTSAKNKTIPPIENKIEENTNEPILDSEEKTDLLINEENQEKIDIVSTNEDKEAENN